MTAPVISLFAEQTMPLAEDIMRLKHIRHLPVIDDDGRLAGIVSHRDLLDAHISSLAAVSADKRRDRQQHVRVRDVMTRDVWTVHPETLASAAGRTLLDHRFGCLPVVDAHGILVGIITERDFLELATGAVGMHD
jgi:CBS domain-containing membrane protein